MDRFYTSIAFTPYTIKVPAPIGEKRGIRLTLKDKKGELFFADCSPLLGYSLESLEEVITQVKALQEQKPIPSDQLCPSLHFALHHPYQPHRPFVPQRYQALIQRPLNPSEIKKLDSFSTLKIKIRLFPEETLIHFLQKMAQTHTLRLDAERRPLSPFLSRWLYEHQNLYQYIEEPLIQTALETQLPIALDETLYLEKKLPSLSHIRALVYKPTLAGGLERIAPFHRYALKHNIPIILSGAYESTLGMAMIIQLHQQLNPHNSDLGLDLFPQDESMFCYPQAPYLFPCQS